MADPLLEVTPDPLRDWPLKLRLNAAAVRLASALYYARVEVYGVGRSPLWDALPMTIKREWIERAEDILREVRPRPLADVVPLQRDWPRVLFSPALTLTAVGTFETLQQSTVCLLTFSDGRQLVSETPGVESKAYALCRHKVRVRVRERAGQPNVLDRLESLA